MSGSTITAPPASPPRSEASSVPAWAANPAPTPCTNSMKSNASGSPPISTFPTLSFAARSLMAAPLEGIRVIDVTNVLAGPFCAYQLALLGADVVKAETPGTGDLARQLGADPALSRIHMGASFLAKNAGKKSITVNLKTEGGKEIFRRLVKSA